MDISQRKENLSGIGGEEEKEDDSDHVDSRWRKQRSTRDRTLGSQRKKGIKEEL